MTANVHPRIVSQWDSKVGYISEWRLQSISGRLKGKSQSGNCYDPTSKKFWLVKAPNV